MVTPTTPALPGEHVVGHVADPNDPLDDVFDVVTQHAPGVLLSSPRQGEPFRKTRKQLRQNIADAAPTFHARKRLVLRSADPIGIFYEDGIRAF